MTTRMDEFRAFVNQHPKLKEEVKNNNRTWQNIYEEWVLFGDNNTWDKYKEEQTNKTISTQKTTGGNILNINMDNVKNIISYVQKINPDSLNKTLNTVQKVIQIAQTVSGPKSAAVSPILGGYNDWWD